jgi:3-hydroxyisobutyrate dehydrogenase-like beta-hydroxyacid dehydrogenase
MSRIAFPGHAAVALGVRAAATPREAAEGAAFVLTMLTDDEASKAVWTADENAALVGLGKEAIAIEISTVSPDWGEDLGSGGRRARRAFSGRARRRLAAASGSGPTH